MQLHRVMQLHRSIQLGVLLIAYAVMGSVALAQEPGQQAPADHSAHHGQAVQQAGQQPMAGGSMTESMMGQGMMDQGMMGSSQTGQQAGQQMMGGCPMMGGMMGQGKGGMMGSGMMGPGMMQGGMAPGMGTVFGTRVTPMMNLSVEDVRGYLAVQLERLNNKRLKIGDIKADDGNITADIVTLDNSLVARLKVDRHTGAIEYQN
jgi:hypothetical protein